jgi:hypothetical protein
MNASQLLPWKFVIVNCSRWAFARHLKSLPKKYRKRAIEEMHCTGWPCKAWPELKRKIELVMNHPRLKSCTESSNASLCNAVDSVSFNPNCANSCIKLLREIEADKTWNPAAWERGDA